MRDVPNDRKFTGQRLDETGLYYYNARYYDPQIGRFISPDTFMLKSSYPQGLNRYSYVFNNPLRYNDPTGNWPPWDQIKAAATRVIDEVKEGLQVAQNKVVEIKQEAIQIYGEVKQVVVTVIKDVGNTIVETPGNIANAVGVEDISHISTSRTPFAPLITVKPNSPLEKVLFHYNNAITLYPIGIFTNEPLEDQFIMEEEGYHWVDEAMAGPGLPYWYFDYAFQYGFNYLAYGFDSDLAYEAISYEREAKSYAAQHSSNTHTPPPSIPEYWWTFFFGP